jgi:hypothetical protein
MTHTKNNIIIIMTLFIVMYLPVFVSYFGDYHIFVFKFIFPVYLFFMFIQYIKIKYSYVLILMSYLVLTFFAMLFFYDNKVVDIFHVASYLMMVIGSYGFAIFILRNDSFNIKIMFRTILVIFFLSLFTEYFFAYLGFNNAHYWDFQIYDALVYMHGNPESTLNTFGNIGSGKGVTPAYALLSIASASYLYSKSKVKYFLFPIIGYLGLMTYSRAYLVALFMYALFEILRIDFKKSFKYLLALFLLLIYIIYYYYDFINIFVRIDFGGSESISGKDVNDSPRMKLLMMQIQAISDKFIFGHGWSGMHQYFLDKFARSTSGELGMLSFLSEQGIIRASYIYILILASLYKTLQFIRLKNSLSKEVYVANLLILTFNFFWGATSVANTRTAIMWFLIFLVLNIKKNKDLTVR